MILMQADWKFVAPEGSATELVRVATLSEKEVTFPQRVSLDFRGGRLNFFDDIQVEMARLNVDDCKVWHRCGLARNPATLVIPELTSAIS